MLDNKTDLTKWSGEALLDVLKIMIQAQPREVAIMDARDEAIKLLKTELFRRPEALYKFVETRLMLEK